jgi:3-oxoacyl-[acyl-carrier protein] reductase
MSPEPSVTIVTGASTGIGRAIALRAAQDGSAILVNSLSDHVGGERTVELVHDQGAEAAYCAADVSTDVGVEHVIKAARQLGTPRVLVNNAGATRPCEVRAWDAAHWRDMLSTNLVSTALMSRAFVTHLDADDAAAIVNVASVRGTRGAARAGIAAYCAAKAGVISLTEALSVELSPAVRVNCVSPGFVQTAYMTRVADELIQQWMASMPTGRFVDVRDVADAVLFMATRRDITGANLIVDGGWSGTRP